MRTKVDVRTALKAVHVVLSRGTPAPDGAATRYRGLDVLSDYDGYTVRLSSPGVELTILFHNRFDLNYKNRVVLDEFLTNIERVAREGA